MNEFATILDRAGILTAEQREHWKMAWLSTVDHKRIGILYMVTALVFFVVGGVEALFIRLQLAVPNNTLLAPGHLQHGVHDAWHDDDFSRRDAGALRPGELYSAAANRRARHGVSATQRLQLLARAVRRHSAAFQFSRGGAPAVGWFAYAPLSETAVFFAAGSGLLGAVTCWCWASARSARVST